MRQSKLNTNDFTVKLNEWNSKSGARVWWYRSNFEPLMKKKIVFRDNYSEARVREYLIKELGVTYAFTLWPAFLPEPPI